MSYNYEQCFWDQNDEGVNVLLTHVSSGIKACNTVVNFFKQKSELEKDFSRRMGAVNDKLLTDMNNYPEFGHLKDSLNHLLTVEKSRAQAHSKQSEIIYRLLYTDTKDIYTQLQAKYTTLSGKIEKLRVDKYNKRTGCKELQKRLNDAEIRARGLKLNQENIIGSKISEQNQKELAKWTANINELQVQIDVLKQEYKASQKFWFSEWRQISTQFGEMETARISMIQTKLQNYVDATAETCVLEQTKMDSLTNQLALFTPADDISKFSSKFGTGRLKEKTNASRGASFMSRDRKAAEPIVIPHITLRDTSNGSNHSATSSGKRSSYVDNIKNLSSKIQRNASRGSDRSYGSKEKIIQQRSYPRNDSRAETELLMPTSSGVHEANDDLQIISITPSKKSRRVDSKMLQKERELNNDQRSQNHQEALSSSTGSSNPTDFTVHVKNKSSVDTMATSVSSYTSNIDDSERFAKSWNSTHRRRKSITTTYLPSPETSDNEIEPETPRIDKRDTSVNTTIINPEMSHNSHMTETKTRTRRKSLAVHNSKNPIEDALYEMNKLQSSATSTNGKTKSKLGVVRDNGMSVTLPIVTSMGETVLKYAKAVYPLLDNEAAGLANFQKNDYLLITEAVNDDWFRGEVYGNDRIESSHKNGLIPVNFIRLLE